MPQPEPWIGAVPGARHGMVEDQSPGCPDFTPYRHDIKRCDDTMQLLCHQIEGSHMMWQGRLSGDRCGLGEPHARTVVAVALESAEVSR